MYEPCHPDRRRTRGAKSARSRRRPAVPEQDLRDRASRRRGGRLPPQPEEAPGGAAHRTAGSPRTRPQLHSLRAPGVVARRELRRRAAGRLDRRLPLARAGRPRARRPRGRLRPRDGAQRLRREPAAHSLRGRRWLKAGPGSASRARGSSRPRTSPSARTGSASPAAPRGGLREETGYSGGEWDPRGALASTPSLKANWAYLFLARGVEETDPPDPDEHELVETVKAPVEGLPGLIRSGEIVSSSGVAAIMLALERLREGS